MGGSFMNLCFFSGDPSIVFRWWILLFCYYFWQNKVMMIICIPPVSPHSAPPTLTLALSRHSLWNVLTPSLSHTSNSWRCSLGDLRALWSSRLAWNTGTCPPTSQTVRYVIECLLLTSLVALRTCSFDELSVTQVVHCVSKKFQPLNSL